MKDVELNFVRDLVFLLKEMAVESKQAAANGDPFYGGRNFAFHEVLDLILSQANGFQLDLAAIELEGFDPWTILMKEKPD